MTTIELKKEKKQSKYPLLGVGDWVVMEDDTLCVIAQIDARVYTLIVIKENDANRKNEIKVSPTSKDNYNMLTDETLDALFSESVFVRKANVSIIER